MHTHAQIRFCMLQELNSMIVKALPLIDFSLNKGMSLLADGVRAIRGLLFHSTKEEIWNAALGATVASGAVCSVLFAAWFWVFISLNSQLTLC